MLGLHGIMLRRSGMQPRVLNHLAIATFNRASPFSSSSVPCIPPSSISSDNNKPPGKKLKAPPKPISISFTGQIKKARSARDAIGVITKIEQQGYHPDVFQYSAIISKCAKQKLVDKALGLLKRMINQGVAPDAVVFCAVIDACAKAGQYTSAISLLNDMEDKYGVEPDVNCLNAAISSCEKAGKWEEAVNLLRKMTEKGAEPNVISYNAVISACEKCAEWGKALEFLDEMKGVGLQPKVISYNSAISACEKGRQPDVALSLLAQIKKEDIQPNDYSYNSAISACEKGGAKYTDTALSLLQEMREEGIRPNEYSYSSAISACEKGGAKYTDTALSLFTEMKKAGVNPDEVTYNSITKTCFDSKRYSEALELAREAMDRGILHINVSTESGLPKWDLHDLTEASACMLLADALQSLVRLSNGEASHSYQDILIITGKGLNTDDPTGPVLREKVPAFLNNVAGLETAAIKRNKGRFLITASSLEKWVTSGACEKFKGLFQNS